MFAADYIAIFTVTPIGWFYFYGVEQLCLFQCRVLMFSLKNDVDVHVLNTLDNYHEITFHLKKIDLCSGMHNIRYKIKTSNSPQSNGVKFERVTPV